MKTITKNDVIVDVYVLCYNEEVLIPFMLDYWNEFATNVYILDNYSTDNSINLLKSENRFNIEIIQHSSDNTFSDYINMQLKNNSWKNSIGKCDFVMVSDFDEVIYSKNILSELYRMKSEKCTIWRHKTYNMVTREFPIYNGNFLHEIMKTGMLSEYNWGKDILFDPNQISEINYCAGSHYCNPVGYTKYFNDSDICMFHFKYLTVEYVIDRYKMYGNRLSDMNRVNGWGIQYDFDENQIIGEFDDAYNKRLDILLELNKK